MDTIFIVNQNIINILAANIRKLGNTHFSRSRSILHSSSTCNDIKGSISLFWYFQYINKRKHSNKYKYECLTSYHGFSSSTGLNITGVVARVFVAVNLLHIVVRSFLSIMFPAMLICIRLYSPIHCP